jgi:hypothetical protein
MLMTTTLLRHPSIANTPNPRSSLPVKFTPFLAMILDLIFMLDIFNIHSQPHVRSSTPHFCCDLLIIEVSRSVTVGLRELEYGRTLVVRRVATTVGTVTAVFLLRNGLF